MAPRLSIFNVITAGDDSNRTLTFSELFKDTFRYSLSFISKNVPSPSILPGMGLGSSGAGRRFGAGGGASGFSVVSGVGVISFVGVGLTVVLGVRDGVKVGVGDSVRVKSGTSVGEGVTVSEGVISMLGVIIAVGVGVSSSCASLASGNKRMKKRNGINNR